MLSNILKAVVMTTIGLLFISSCSDDNNFSLPDDTTDIEISIEQPNGGEIYYAGGTREIKWTSNFDDYVRIELFKADSLYLLIGDSIENSGKFEWKITDEIVFSDNFKICLTRISDHSSVDMSDNYFKITYPALELYDPPSEITNSEYKVQWYGNSDESELQYFFCVTTDTTLTDSEALSVLEGKPWGSTTQNYALGSFPMVPYNSESVFVDSTSYTVGDISIQTKTVFSRFFIYCTDGFGAVSDVKSHVFARVNNKPKYPIVFSSKLQVNGYNSYWNTVGSDSTCLILSKVSATWPPIDFKWMGSDPDGNKLEFKWELWERERIGWTDELIALVVSSDGWSGDNLTKSFSSEIWNHNNQGKYAFKVYVRDDALEESKNHATVNFEVYAPTFDKGILLIDDTDPTLYPPPSLLMMGNPDAALTNAHYEEILRHAGYLPEGETADSLSLFRIKRFEKATEFVGWDYVWEDGIVTDSTAVYRAIYRPELKELVQYRLVVIASDDRSNINGVDFTGNPPYTGYTNYLSAYLDVGGKMFILGNSVVMGKYYASPNQLPINKYLAPFTFVFDGVYEQNEGISGKAEEFFRDYFGIYSMTFPEQKTYFTENSAAQLCSDHYLTDNYDFIGSSVYEDVTDPNFKHLRIDSTRVNDSWWDRTVSGRIQMLALKDNGTVFTGVPTLEIFKGETLYKYKSIYDLPIADSLAYDDVYAGLTHYLWNKRFRVEEFESSPSFATQTTIGSWTQETVTAERWATNTTTPFSLLRSLKSGVIAANDTSDVSVSNVELLSEGTISFAYRTSSYIDPADSLTGDVLNFYIDGVNMSALEETKLWCGENEWRQVSYNLGSGTHNFKWQYLKGGAGPGGSDAVWIDKLMITDTHSPVLQRSGTVAARYAEENGYYKTAFFGIPTFFMDNSENQVSDMFKAMVDWFDLSVNPADNWKKK